jgi:DHA2 family multidrug resistance protein
LPPRLSRTLLNHDAATAGLTPGLGGSVGVSFTTTMLEERTQFHHARLAEHITAYNGYAWPTPLAPIDGVVQAPATIMSYLDIFWLLGALARCLWPLALFLPRMRKGAAPAH